MYITTVAPVQKGIPFDTLTYFSQDPIPEGYLVRIPFQSKETYGVVTESRSLIDSKLDIKAAQFTLKKISQIVGPGSIDSSFISASKQISKQMFTPLGAFLGEILPLQTLEQRQYLLRPPIINGLGKTQLIQGGITDRSNEYKSIIRNSLAKKELVILVAPTIESVTSWKKILGKGIERRIFILHSDVTKSEQKKAFRDLFELQKGGLLIATPHFATIPWINNKTLILDEPSHVGFQSRGRFPIDYSSFLETLSKERGQNLIIGDQIIPFKYIWINEKNARSIYPKNYIPEKLHILDISKRQFQIIPEEIISLIKHCEATKKTLFFYANNKGIAPFSVCNTCKKVVDCTVCKTPLVLKYDKEKNRSFFCQSCGHTEPVTYTCSYCGSWDINPKEVGSDALVDEIKTFKPNIPLKVIESNTKSDEEIKESLSKNALKGGAIIIATDKIWPYLPEIGFSVIPTFDRLINRANLKAGEKALRIIFNLNENTKENIIVMTKNPNQSLLESIEKKEIYKYVDKERIATETFGYPPFGFVIKITVNVLEHEKEKAISSIITLCKPLEAFHVGTKRGKQNGKYLSLIFIIKTGRSFFDPNEEHYNKFTQNIFDIPYNIKIETNPENFW